MFNFNVKYLIESQMLLSKVLSSKNSEMPL